MHLDDLDQHTQNTIILGCWLRRFTTIGWQLIPLYGVYFEDPLNRQKKSPCFNMHELRMDEP